MTRFSIPLLLVGCVAALAACTASGTAAVTGPTPLPMPMAADSCGPTTGPSGAGCLITPAPGASAAATAQPGATGLDAQPLVGLALPDLPYLGVDGKAYQTAALKGSPLLLTVFAHWCSHCQIELPLIQTWVKSQAPKGLVWVAIEGSMATPEQVKTFATTYQIDLPLYLDPAGGIVGAVKASGYPTDLFVDATGTVRGGSRGTFDAPAYEALLTKYPK